MPAQPFHRPRRRTMSEPIAAEASSKDRAPGGRFAKGNPGGPGNPFARQTAALRQAFLDAVTPEDMQEIARRLIMEARLGNMTAAKLVLSYVLGKPPAAQNPDTLDQEECQQYQQGPTNQDMEQAVQDKVPAELAAVVFRGLAQAKWAEANQAFNPSEQVPPADEAKPGHRQQTAETARCHRQQTAESELPRGHASARPDALHRHQTVPTNIGLPPNERRTMPS